MLAVELFDDAEVSRTRRVHGALIERGYLVGRRPGVPVLRIDPALTIEEEDLRGFLRALESVLAEPGLS
jgi:4-aminobutyrate aminotransferase-like enzyme